MPESPAGARTAYVCECGKKWVFPKAAAAAPKAARRSCKCGRILVVGGGFIYSLPAKSGQFSVGRSTL